jgi:hypothetical protein
MMPDTPRPDDSRSIRLGQVRRAMERVAPPSDDLPALPGETAEEAAAKRRQKTDVKQRLRAQDEQRARKEGRTALQRRFQKTADRITGNTPPDGEPTQPPSSVDTVDPHDHDPYEGFLGPRHERDPLENTEEPDDDSEGEDDGCS